MKRSSIHSKKHSPSPPPSLSNIPFTSKDNNNNKTILYSIASISFLIIIFYFFALYNYRKNKQTFPRMTVTPLKQSLKEMTPSHCIPLINEIMNKQSISNRNIESLTVSKSYEDEYYRQPKLYSACAYVNHRKFLIFFFHFFFTKCDLPAPGESAKLKILN